MDIEIEHPHKRHHFADKGIDLALALTALFVSLISIGVAWHHGQVMKELVHQNERLVEASSLPYVQLSMLRGAAGDLSFVATNEGVGPAKIETAQISVDGRPVETLEQLVDACCGASARDAFKASSLEGRMVRPGDEVAYIGLDGAAVDGARLADLTKTLAASGRVTVSLCYCSVFDDCWTAVSRDPTPNPVKSCPIPAHPYRE
ncbi:MAG: hypothetical protein ABIO80_08580 [Sphingomicrobium sp.]